MSEQFKPGKSKVLWRSMDFLPYHFGFCPDEKSWDAEMKRLQITDAPYPKSDGNCSHFVNDGLKGGACSIVTMNHKKRPSFGNLGLIAHESTHVWRQMCKSIGERKPSSEFEAYAIQHIITALVRLYEISGRGKILR